MQPIFISGSVYAEAIIVPVVSLIRAATLMGRPWVILDWRRQRGEWYRWDKTYSLLQDVLQRGNDILALDTVNVKALGPALQNSMVDVVLSGRVGEGEAQGQLGEILILVMVLDELLQTIGNVLPQLLSGTGAELLGHLILGLGDVESALLLGQGDLANAQVGAAHVEGEESTLLFTVGEAKDPGNVHRLWCCQSANVS